MTETAFHDRLVRVAIHRRERVAGRQKDTFVTRFRRYHHENLFKELVTDYPPADGFIVSIFPTPASEVL